MADSHNSSCVLCFGTRSKQGSCSRAAIRALTDFYVHSQFHTLPLAEAVMVDPCREGPSPTKKWIDSSRCSRLRGEVEVLATSHRQQLRVGVSSPVLRVLANVPNPSTHRPPGSPPLDHSGCTI